MRRSWAWTTANSPPLPQGLPLFTTQLGRLWGLSTLGKFPLGIPLLKIAVAIFCSGNISGDKVHVLFCLARSFTHLCFLLNLPKNFLSGGFHTAPHQRPGTGSVLKDTNGGNGTGKNLKSPVPENFKAVP